MKENQHEKFKRVSNIKEYTSSDLFKMLKELKYCNYNFESILIFERITPIKKANKCSKRIERITSE